MIDRSAKLSAFQRLKGLHAELAAGDRFDSTKLESWQLAVQTALTTLFGSDSAYAKTLSQLRWSPLISIPGPTPGDYDEAFRRGATKATGIVASAIHEAEEYMAASPEKDAQRTGERKPQKGETPDTPFRALLQFVGPLKPVWRVSILLVIGAIVVLYALWQSMPDDVKKRALERVTKQPTSLSSSSGTWLIFQGVEVYGASSRAQVKVVAIVNNTRLIYPTLPDVEWLEVGPTMAPQQFHLPPPVAGRYAIRLEMTLRSPEHIEQTAELKSTRTIVVTSVPTDARYQLHDVDGGVRGPGVAAVVRFTVSSSPNVQ